MKIIQVNSRAEWRAFHSVPHLVYKRDPTWIAHIEKDIESVFDPTKNKRFENGSASVYVAINERNKPVGRIAAFIDHEINKQSDVKTGGLGFFECLEDKELGFALFEKAAEYLSQFDIQAIDGPINFGERDKFYGLQTYGFEHKLFQENYNPTYYRKIFEDWGFEPFQQMLTFRFFSRQIPIDKFRRISERVMSRYPVKLAYADPKNYLKNSEDICTIYNDAFKDYEHYKPIEPSVVYKMFKEAAPILDPQLVSIGYMDGEPAAVAAALPNIAPFTKPLKGKMDFWRAPIFMWKKWTAKRPDVKGVLSGVRSQFQNKGIYACVLTHMMSDRNIDKYRSGYMPSIAGHNDLMINTFTKFNANVVREHIGFRKMLVPNLDLNPYRFKEFEHA